MRISIRGIIQVIYGVLLCGSFHLIHFDLSSKAQPHGVTQNFISSKLFAEAYSNVESVVEPPDELMQAVYIGDVDKVKFLLDLDPNVLTSRPPVLVNRVEKEHGRTSIMVCGFDPQYAMGTVDRDCERIIQLLHQAGANLSHVDYYGWDALSLAAVRGMKSVCRYLLKNGAEVNHKDQNNRTALMKAAAHAHPDLYSLLLNFHADQSLRDVNGHTALHHAVMLAMKNESYYTYFDKILSSTVPTSLLDTLTDFDSRNILMYAVINNNYAVTELVLKRGADPRLKDKFGIATTYMPTDEVLKNLLQEYSALKVEEEHKKWLQSTSTELELDLELEEL